MKQSIVLRSAAVSGGRVVYEFDAVMAADPFLKRSFFIESDLPLEPVDESVLAVPFAAVMAPIAWMTGADLVIPSLDADFVRSLARIRVFFRRWYSRRWPFSGALRTAPVKNRLAPEGSAVLFSGGLDSITSAIHRADLRPALVNLFGADIPTSQRRAAEDSHALWRRLAAEQGLPIRFLSTDFRSAVDEQRLAGWVWGSWYLQVAHGLMVTTFCAPALSRSVRTLYMASTLPSALFRSASGGDSALIDGVAWAGTTVRMDNEELMRPAKVAFLKKDPSWLPYLRVCNKQFESRNCGRCEKCLRTICDLLVNDIDPAGCNFPIDEDTLPGLKRRIVGDFYGFFSGETHLAIWRSYQDAARLGGFADRYGSREFFAWLKDYGRLRKPMRPLGRRVGDFVRRIKAGVQRRLGPRPR